MKQFLVHRSGCSFAKFGTVGSFILTGSDNESSKIYAIEHEVRRHFCFIKITIKSSSHFFNLKIFSFNFIATYWLDKSNKVILKSEL